MDNSLIKLALSGKISHLLAHLAMLVLMLTKDMS